MPQRLFATFRSGAFNTTESKEYFINPECFGDDLARWFIDELNQRGVKTDAEPGQEDFGWYLTFELAGISYHVIVGYRLAEPNGEETGEWLLWVERTGFLRMLSGRSKKGITPEAVQLVHQILTSSPQISDVRWFDEEDTNEERPFPNPI